MRQPVLLPPRYSPELQEIGHGGFATVYRTLDLDLDLPVAVKVPVGRRDRDSAREVAAELQTGALLRHPGIVQVLDAGTDSNGQAWLVMELAAAGSLAPWVKEGPPPWSELLGALDQILDALGWAHAKGVVHRDIKDQNILLARSADGRLSPKLADFGLAKARRGPDDFESTRLGAGTLLFMAPEAFEHNVASIHPGLDFYAFGVLLYLLVSGRSPWDVGGLPLVFAKTQGPHRPLEARPGYPVPAGLAGIVDRLLARSPGERYSLAADVREALRAGEARAATLPLRASTSSTLQDDDSIVRPHSLSAPRDLPAPPDMPPMAPAPAVALHRVPRFVGRERERRALWTAATSGAPAGFELRGEPGAGRSRLAQWLAESLERSGLALPLRVHMRPGTRPAEAMAQALRQHLALGRLVGEALQARVDAWARARPSVDGIDADALGRWLDPTPTRSAAAAIPEDPAGVARAVAAAMAVLRLDGRRVALAHVQEARTGGRGRALAEDLLRSAAAHRFPLLVLYEPPGGSSLQAPGGFQTVTLEPLPHAHISDLLSDLLPPGLSAEELLPQVGGNPLRAVEISKSLADQLRRRIPVTAPMVETPAPSSPSPGAPGEGPESTITVPQLVFVRVHALLEAPAMRAPGEALFGLLALLPSPCPRTLFVAALQAAGWEVADAAPVLDAAQMAGLVRELDDGALAAVVPRFGGGVDQLLGSAERARALRCTAATALLDHVATEPRAPLGWRAIAGRLLREADRPGEAVEAFAHAARTLCSVDAVAARETWELVAETSALLPPPQGRLRRLEAALGVAREARQAGDLEGAAAALGRISADALSDERRAEWLELNASLLVLRGEPSAALAVARDAARAFEACGDATGIARATIIVGDALLRSDQTAEALLAFADALRSARSSGATREELTIRRLLVRAHRLGGDHEQAARECEAALALSRTVGDVVAEGVALRELGNFAVLDGRFGEAESHFRRAFARLEAGGFRLELPATRLSLGELARARGDLRLARSEYSAALGQARAYGMAQDAMIALLDLGITELALGRPEQARRRIEAVDRRVEPGSPTRLRPWIEALRLAVLSEQARWTEAEDVLLALADNAPADRDLLELVEHAVRAADRAGEIPLANDAADLALGIAEQLGDTAAVRRIRELLASLGASLR